MFCENIAEDGDIPVDNPHLYNLGEYNRSSPGQQPLITGSVFLFSPIM